MYRLRDDLAIVQTVDFFTPIVDDPYTFGQVAAANALSDIYAMGARPLTALNLVGFPVDRLPKEVLADILRGGADTVRRAGAILIGGHSIDDPVPKYGLAVTGMVHPDKILTKAGARAGEKLVLTKPIGVGIITTGIKKGIAPRPAVEAAIRAMVTLNDVVDVLHRYGVRGATDVTGFGLLGHASEMARGSALAFRIRASAVPVLPDVYDLAREKSVPGGSRSNLKFLTSHRYVDFDQAITEEQRAVLCDAVTSGGLLVAVPEDGVAGLVAALRERGTLAAAVIGEVLDPAASGLAPGVIEVLP